jgi:hypothetical protein
MLESSNEKGHSFAFSRTYERGIEEAGTVDSPSSVQQRVHFGMKGSRHKRLTR